MLDMDFPDENFDVIWAEGVGSFISFETCLEGWRTFIKPNGFLVIHETTWLRPDPPQEITDHLNRMFPGIRTAPEYIQSIRPYGYELIEYFPLPEDTWWFDYFGPLEARISELRRKYVGDRGTQQVLNSQQREVDLFKKYKRWYGSAFYVMQKRA
jgi:hypothetical protein